MTPSDAAPTSRPPHLRLFHALAGFAVLATVLMVGRNLGNELLAQVPPEGGLGVRFAAVPVQAWIFAVVHLVAAVASLGLGYLVISLVYPRRHLAREAQTNPAAALQAGAHLLGAAVVAAASWGGCDAASLAVSAAFCALGWVAIIVISAGHRLVTAYRDHEEIADGNVAAAIASAGLHLAIALVTGHAIQGQFEGWPHALAGFGLALCWALLLFPMRQLVLARLILGLSPRQLDAAIAGGRDVWLGAAEGIGYVAAALCLVAGW